MAYSNEQDIYQKSLETLKEIVRNQNKFGYKIYLLGGWAVWLYNPYMKSKDIDFMIRPEDFFKLRNYLLSVGFRETGAVLEKKGFAMLWGKDKIELDVYDRKVGPFDIMPLIQNAISKNINSQNILVLALTDLFTLKAATALARMGTAKGEKDFSDLLALLDSGLADIGLSEVNQKVNLSRLFALLFKDYKSASSRYPLELDRYKKIKRTIEKLIRP